MNVCFKECWYPDFDSNTLRRSTFYIHGDRITFDKPSEQLDAVFEDTLVTPGFFNAHSHVAMDLFRAVGDDVALDDWLNNYIWPLESRLNDDYVYWSSLLAGLELIRSGVTTFLDMYFWETATLNACNDLGIRPIFTPGIIERPGWEASLERVQQLRKLGAIVGVGPHALYTVSMKIMPEIVNFAREQNLFLHMHLMETSSEEAYIHNMIGTDYLKKLDDIGMFEVPVVFAHGVHFSDEDFRFLSSRENVLIAHCPQSNLKLSSGLFRWDKAKDFGVKVGIGTDGAASNNNLDYVEEMRTAVLLARGISGRPDLLSPIEVLKSAMALPGKVLGIPVGEIKEGNWADVVVWDIDDISMVPVDKPEDWISHVVYSAGHSAVKDVFVQGRWVLQDKHFPGVNLSEVVREVNKRRERIRKEDLL
jgi:5-methylthioadenosine/S-adenosylhomocysteine deaminase